MSLLDRRGLLAAIGATAAITVAGPGVAGARKYSGTITYAGGIAIPKGDLRVAVEGVGSDMRVGSDGKSAEIPFTIPAGTNGSPPLRIDVRLERSDGWLLAHGRATLKAGKPVTVVLNEAVY